jgi:CRISPR/Cas system CSM-associated protein Csm4 (group 5 of RAMP superfamily)
MNTTTMVIVFVVVFQLGALMALMILNAMLSHKNKKVQYVPDEEYLKFKENVRLQYIELCENYKRKMERAKSVD